MTNKRKSRIGIAICSFIILLAIGAGAFVSLHFHWNLAVQTETFAESSRELYNPNRGFYYIYGFRIKDENTDWNTEVAKRMEEDTDSSLALIEVNLQEYRDGAITEAGMRDMESLFAALAKQKKQYIVRFLYDWNGENAKYEPHNIKIIVGHMKQVEPILRRYAEQIFTLQGLFIGNWGEMNGTQYVDEDSLRVLASTLASVSESSTYLAVRTPMHWRKITQTSDLNAFLESDSPYAYRLGLFNDGMLGNEGDYGTYGTQKASEAGIYKEWTRDEELNFQDALCRTVPIGGEVINDNQYNDLENAIADLKRMHVTYLNEDYDRNVLEKWKSSIIQTDDCFNGTDGLAYIREHLGYRFVIKECHMQQNFWKDTLDIKITIQNVGFAPIYKMSEANLVFVPLGDGTKYSVDVAHNLERLPGGSESDQIATIHATIPLNKLSRMDYDVGLLLKDKASGEIISFANEQATTSDGVKIGQIQQ